MTTLSRISIILHKYKSLPEFILWKRNFRPLWYSAKLNYVSVLCLYRKRNHDKNKQIQRSSKLNILRITAFPEGIIYLNQKSFTKTLHVHWDLEHPVITQNIYVDFRQAYGILFSFY